jgi:hypothetical protein
MVLRDAYRCVITNEAQDLRGAEELAACHHTLMITRDPLRQSVWLGARLAPVLVAVCRDSFAAQIAAPPHHAASGEATLVA